MLNLYLFLMAPKVHLLLYLDQDLNPMIGGDFLDDVLVVDKGPRDWGGLGGLSGGSVELSRGKSSGLRRYRGVARCWEDAESAASAAQYPPLP